MLTANNYFVIIFNMNRKKLEKIILDQREKYLQRTQNSSFISRELEKNFISQKNDSHIQIISGIRRSGKSTLMDMMKMRTKKADYYLNFDDERLLNFSVEDFQPLVEIFLELFGEQNTFYFDEIQNIPKWERFIRRIYEEGNKIYITGSNASMLSQELGTHLTGRYVQYELYPFSFAEFLGFKQEKYDQKFLFTTKKQAKIKRHFNEYLEFGGFPEYLLSKKENRLKELYDNIIYRDVITRYNLKEIKSLKELVHFTASNIGKEISYRKIAKIVGLKSSLTVKEYLHYFENSYLNFLISRFNYSLKKQIYANKKTYFIDSALAKIIGFRFSEDCGRFLENLVFLELKRRGLEIYYFREKGECDFLIRKGYHIFSAIQVAQFLDEHNKKREINGLVEALKKFKLKSGIILTEDQEYEFQQDGKKIKVLPIWKWLLKK